MCNLHPRTGLQLLKAKDQTCDLNTQTSDFQNLAKDLNMHLLAPECL